MKYLLFYFLKVIKTHVISKYWVLFVDLQIIYKSLYAFSIKKIDLKKIEKNIENFKINYQQLLGIKNTTMNFHLIVYFIFYFFNFNFFIF
jgi:hypothetical protein